MNSPQVLLVAIACALQLALGGSTDAGCKLPERIKNGKWQVLGPGDKLEPGTIVPPETALRISCDKGFKLLGTQLGICGQNDEWEWQTIMGHCSKSCPPLHDSKDVKVTCTVPDNETGYLKYVDCTQATDGAIAEFECMQYYTIVRDNSTKDIRSGGSGLSLCQNGTWSASKPNCNRKCGLHSLKGVPLSVNGTKVREGRYPWQVGIYEFSRSRNRISFLCGGSLINEQVVVTAAHCVTTLEEGYLLNTTSFLVAAGKNHPKIIDQRDLDAQILRVKKIHVPPDYKGYRLDFFADIAIMITEIPFKLTQKIQPICVDWKTKFRTKFFQPHNLGFVSGFGAINEEGATTDTLREIQVPYVHSEECSKSISEEDRAFLTSDKLCLGYVNQSKSVCAGDSGGALVFKNPFDNRFYLTGVVSISPDVKHDKSCNSQLYSLYTEIYKYVDFLREKSVEFQTEPDIPTTQRPTDANTTDDEAGCVLPKRPQHGKLEIIQLGVSVVQSFKRGPLVGAGAITSIECDQGYSIIGSKLNLCLGTKWESEPAICTALCPPLNVSDSTEISCSKKGIPIECSLATNGTIAIIQCPTSPGQVYSICNGDGQWNPKQPTCASECGILNSNGTKRYPWVAAIYREDEKGRVEFITSGTIVNERTIITAAHHFVDSLGKQDPEFLYTISVGNYYQLFNDSEDANKTQHFKVAKIVASNQFRRDTFLGDIAVLVTEKCINFTDKIQAVCLDTSNMFEDGAKNGVVSGWAEYWPFDIEISEYDYVSNKQCVTGPEYIDYLTPDKFCARQKGGICDIGGNGMFFQNPSDKRHYLAGITSVILDGFCGEDLGVTRVSSHFNSTIFDTILTFAPSKEECIRLDQQESIASNTTRLIKEYHRNIEELLFRNVYKAIGPRK